ncbi:MAG: oligosaccharide flippase family protein [Ignavibacteria bacterium]|nr:oligosaccharide flippase family protein [Ignavibacteria bacterium]
MESSENRKGLFSHTFLYTFGNLISRGLNFLLLPFYSHYISPEDFGVYSVIVSVLTIASTVINLGLPGIFLKNLSSSESIEEKKRFLSNTISFITSVSLPLLILVIGFSRSLSQIIIGKDEFYVEIILGLISILSLNYSYYFSVFYVAEERSKEFVLKNSAASISNFVFNLIFVVLFKSGINGIFLAQILSSVILIFLSRDVLKKYFTFTFDLNYLKPILIGSLPLLLSGVFTIVIELIDRLLVFQYLGETKAGIYSFGYRLALIFNLYILSFKSAWIPHYFNLKLIEKDKADHLGRIFTKLVYSSVLIIFVISYGVNEVFKLKIDTFTIFDLKYKDSTSFIIYLLIGYFFSLLMAFYSIAPFKLNKLYHFLFADLIAMVLNLIFNIYLIPRIGIDGAAIATMISFLAGAFYLFIYNLGKIKINYEYKSLFIILFAGFCGLILYKKIDDIFVGFVILLIMISIGFILKIIKRDWREILKI